MAGLDPAIHRQSAKPSSSARKFPWITASRAAMTTKAGHGAIFLHAQKLEAGKRARSANPGNAALAVLAAPANLRRADLMHGEAVRFAVQPVLPAHA